MAVVTASFQIPPLALYHPTLYSAAIRASPNNLEQAETGRYRSGRQRHLFEPGAVVTVSPEGQGSQVAAWPARKVAVPARYSQATQSCRDLY